jgi:sterol desaturase/sphingolipid hydroxylase (fatty acid hydroxylase superfamily)
MILKSVDGIPAPEFPQGVVLAAEARKARRRFYPVTILYTIYAAIVLPRAFYRHPFLAAANLALGVAIWTWLEYIVHRFILHGRFPDGSSWLKHRVHTFFDTMHGDHHQRPWDGLYINGYLDSIPFAVVFILLAWPAPLHTAPVVVAALLLCYVGEEWVHYTVHFHRFRWKYFDYIRRHHMYHHSRRGAEVGYGLTSGLWDLLVGTRIPADDRKLLYARGPRDRAA